MSTRDYSDDQREPIWVLFYETARLTGRLPETRLSVDQREFLVQHGYMVPEYIQDDGVTVYEITKKGNQAIRDKYRRDFWSKQANVGVLDTFTDGLIKS